ncbi:MAG: hypothetical protein R3195_19770 [Gemmatimonadota bacterium]|nr:hypothetical protein [Gemmatimonadota bacterium]
MDGPRSFRRRRAAALTTVTVAATALVLALSGSRGETRPFTDPATDPSPEIDTLRLLVESLEIESALAESGEFYLVLDPDAFSLSLFLDGAPLRSYEIGDLQTGAPRRLFIRGERVDPRERSWTGAKLRPERRVERVEIVSDAVEPPDPSGTVGWIPPTPLELNPTPERFVVTYDGGVSLEVVAGEPRDSTAAPTRRVRGLATLDRLRLLWPGWEARVRIRVILPREDAGALYRSLPAGSHLLVRP